MALGEDTSLRLPSDRMIRWELFAVLALSLGASALNAALSLIGSLLARPVAVQPAGAAGRPRRRTTWLDLAYQIAFIAEALAPVLLVFYLLSRTGERPSDIGLDATQPGKDIARGAVLAAVIGGAGLVLYLAAFHLGSA